MNNRISVATIDSPEFINLQQMDINPLMSKCDIKVLYIGQNRNMSCITKEVAVEMSKTLRGCPIVGQYIESKEDFGDHGDQIIIDGEGIKFNKLTKPYGFVAPDAKVWFKTYEDTDAFGNVTVREYLMTEGYLWTGQFEECKRVLTNNNPQSMELDENSLKGFWSTDTNKGVDFFIINDAVFSKLCILGDDVEPCFEGANVSAPTLSSTFSKDNEFGRSLFQMMNELKFALNNSEGGNPMHDEIQNAEVATAVETEVSVETPATAFENEENVEAPETIFEDGGNAAPADAGDDASESQPENESSPVVEEQPQEDETTKDNSEQSEQENSEVENEDNAEPAYDEEKFNLQQQLADLQVEFAKIKAENEQLLAFKKEVEDKEKDELISSFYMLSDEDKKNVIENKSNYSLREIKAELSMICVDKQVSFAKAEDVVENSIPITYNLNTPTIDETPSWLKSVEEIRNRNK